MKSHSRVNSLLTSLTTPSLSISTTSFLILGSVMKLFLRAEMFLLRTITHTRRMLLTSTCMIYLLAWLRALHRDKSYQLACSAARLKLNPFCLNTSNSIWTSSSGNLVLIRS